MARQTRNRRPSLAEPAGTAVMEPPEGHVTEHDKGTFMDWLPIPVVAMDTAHTIEYVNQAAANVAGLKPEECTGKKFWEVLYDSQACHDNACAAGKAVQTGKVCTGEAHFQVRGKDWPVRVICSPRYDAERRNIIGCFQVMYEAHEEIHVVERPRSGIHGLLVELVTVLDGDEDAKPVDAIDRLELGAWHVGREDPRNLGTAGIHEIFGEERKRNLEDGLTGFLRSQQEVSFLVDAVAASQKSVKLSLDQYDFGLIDYQRVLDSQSSLLRQQDSLAQAQGQIVKSLVSTYRALGGGWQIRYPPRWWLYP